MRHISINQPKKKLFPAVRKYVAHMEVLFLLADRHVLSCNLRLSGMAEFQTDFGIVDEWFIRRKGFAFGVMWAGTGVSTLYLDDFQPRSDFYDRCLE